jgi:hypothetical protein
MPKFLSAPIAVLAVVLAALVFSVSPAAAAHKTSNTPCWKTLLSDYFRDGRIDQTYQLKCYNQALSHLDEDTLIYGSAVRDIKRALASATFGFNKNHPGGGGPGPNSVLPVPTGGKPPSNQHENVFQRLANAIGPGNATSIPLPLLILAGVGLLLVLLALASYLTRRIQARRGPPQPATAPPTPRRK